MARRQAELDRQAACPRRPSRAGASAPRRSTRRSSARRSCASASATRACVGITAAMNSGTGLNLLQKAMPDRYFDVGIAEQQALLFAAGPRAAGLAAGRGDLLDVPPARVRPDRPRRLPAVAARRDLHGPRRPRRRRRPDAPRRLRHRLPALPAQHHADGAARRGDARAHAPHRAAARGRPGRASATRAARRSACRCPRAPRAARDRHGRDPARGRAGGARRLRHRRQQALGAADLLAEGGLDVTVADARFAKPLDAGPARAARGGARPARDRRGGRARRRLRHGRVGVAVGGRAGAARSCASGCPTATSPTARPQLLHAEVGFTPERIAERIQSAVLDPRGSLASA